MLFTLKHNKNSNLEEKSIMTELIINIAPEKEALIKMLIEELGGEVIEVHKNKYKESKRNKKRMVSKVVKEKSDQPSPTFLFGKWKDLDMDAKKLRAEAWDRSSKFL